MRISHFFIDRPIFAGVIAIVFVILGGVAFLRLPIAQYPEIAPPVINASCRKSRPFKGRLSTCAESTTGPIAFDSVSSRITFSAETETTVDIWPTLRDTSSVASWRLPLECL